MNRYYRKANMSTGSGYRCFDAASFSVGSNDSEVLLRFGVNGWGEGMEIKAGDRAKG